MKNKYLKISILLSICLFSICFFTEVKAASVDVIFLFWGQSNMVGGAGKFDSEKQPDKRNISQFVDDDIIKQYKQMNYVSVQIPSGVAKEFKIDSNGNGYLADITASTKILGEKLTYKNEKLYPYSKNLGYYSLQPSYGTNMIPQFCKTYYTLTGRQVVVVMAAHSGEAIGHYLPYKESTDNPKEYIYEAMKTKYLNAIQYLKSKGYTIENKFYIVNQGCGDSNSKLCDYYYDTFLKMHKHLREDLGLSFGAIVGSTGRTSSTAEKKGYIKKVHDAQVLLAKNNSDIITATNLGYDLFINNHPEYFCSTNSKNNNSSVKCDNSIHYTSATLSQIGKNSAKSIYKYLRTISSNQAPHICVSIDNNKLYYHVYDGNTLAKFQLNMNNSKGKSLINTKLTTNISNVSNRITSTLPAKNVKHIYYGSSTDSVGNTINCTFAIKNVGNGMYRVNNSPNLYSIFGKGNIVYFMFADGTGLDKTAYVKNLSQKNYTSKTLTELKTTVGNRGYVAVNLNEMTKVNENYYIYVKVFDTSADKLYTEQRITIIKK